MGHLHVHCQPLHEIVHVERAHVFEYPGFAVLCGPRLFVLPGAHRDDHVRRRRARRAIALRRALRKVAIRLRLRVLFNRELPSR